MRPTGVFSKEASHESMPRNRLNMNASNRTTRYCIFRLDTTSVSTQNLGNFYCPARAAFCADSRCGAGSLLQRLTRRGSRDEKDQLLFLGVKTCSIYRVGLCSASMRNVRRVVIGCVLAPQGWNCAATAARRFTMYRRPWVHDCVCAPARSEAIARRAAHPG